MRRLAPIIVLLLLCFAAAAPGERRVIAPPGTDLGLPFSAGILSQDFLFLAGAIGNRPGTTTVEGDVAAQVRQTLDNLGKVLEGAGLDFSRVVCAHVYLADVRHFQTMNEIYGAAFADDRPPARTTIEADVAIPGAATEIGMIAARAEVELEWIVPAGWRPSPLYAWGVRAGDTLFLSGMVSVDPKSGELVTGDLRRQARQVLDNVAGVLAAAGMQPRDVATCGVYLADARDYAAMNEVYGAFFPEAPPARATVRARLANPALAIEVTCVAVRGERKVVTPAGESPSPRPLSAGVLAGGRLYLSGMVGRQADGTYPHGVEAQTRVALDRLAATLAAADLDWGDVESATVYLADVRHYQAMNAVYAAALPDPKPARATVGTPLMSPDALVEIRMVASKKP
jgi:reactive intermediate/imine deaminase